MDKKLFAKDSATSFRVFKTAALCVAALCTLLRTLNLLFFYDSAIGYYEKGSILPIVFTVLTAVSIIAILILCASVFRKTAPDIEQYTLSSKCASVFVALAFAVVFISNVLSPYSWAEYIYGTSVGALFFAVTALNIIAPALAAVYFILYAFEKCTPSMVLSGGILAIIYFTITLALSYFNIYVQMNAPEKLASHLCCICAMVFILSEMRVMCGSPKNAVYLFSASASSIALCSCSLSTIIASFSGALNGGKMTAPSLSSFVFLSLGIFAVVRLIMLEPKASENISEIQQNEPNDEAGSLVSGDEE